MKLGSTFWAVVSLVLVYTAYVAEVYRAGIESVHESQAAAARSLGLSRWESLRFVILPQAIRRVIPPLLNDFIGLQKDTALVASIGVVEALLSLKVIKAKLEAVEASITTIEQEFLAHIVLPSGSTVGEWAAPQLALAYERGQMPAIMPGGGS